VNGNFPQLQSEDERANVLKRASVIWEYVNGVMPSKSYLYRGCGHPTMFISCNQRCLYMKVQEQEKTL